jgi:isoamyl acetate esterase
MQGISSIVTVLLLVSLVGVATPEAVKLKNGDRIVFFGDSIIAGGGATNGFITLIKKSVNKAHPDWGVEMINAGQSGNCVRNLQARLQADVLDKKPAIVFIKIGVNDVGYLTAPRRTGTTEDAFEAGLREIIGKIKAVGAQVVLCTPSVIGEKTDGTNRNDKTVDEYSDISRRVAADTQALLLDLRKAFMDYLKANNPENQEKGILTTDNVHLSPAGNKLVAEQMLKVLGVALAEAPVAPAKDHGQ